MLTGQSHRINDHGAAVSACRPEHRNRVALKACYLVVCSKVVGDRSEGFTNLAINSSDLNLGTDSGTYQHIVEGVQFTFRMIALHRLGRIDPDTVVHQLSNV